MDCHGATITIQLVRISSNVPAFFRAGLQMDTPPLNAHRVLAPLNWSHSSGRATDGDVISNIVNGVKVYRLRAQPRGNAYRGVSFFVPDPDPRFLKLAHAHVGKHVHGCKVAARDGPPLPSGVKFVNDHPLEVPVKREGEETVMVQCGQHWSLYAAVAMPAAEFEDAYAALISHLQTCVDEEQESLVGQPDGAATRVLDSAPDSTTAPAQTGDSSATALISFVGTEAVDREYMPSDQMTSVAVMALDDLAASSPDANVRLFADLFSLHLRATDMGFTEVMGFGGMTNTIAAALSGWQVRDPFLASAAFKAHVLLTNAMDDAEANYMPPVYQPYWVSS